MTDKFNNTKIEREGPLNRYNFTDFFQGFDQVPIIKQTFGENVVEISCHGSSYVQNEIIKLFIDNGCRAAKAGEFTLRAFLNGKIDLIQAESINDLIKSETNIFANKSMENMTGRLSDEIKKIKENAQGITANVEYDLDLNENEFDNANNKLLSLKVGSMVSRLMKVHFFLISYVVE